MDKCVAEVHSRGYVSATLHSAMIAIIKLHAPRMDIYNSRWAGLVSWADLGPGIYAEDLRSELDDEYGYDNLKTMPQAERIDAARTVIGRMIELGPVFYAAAIRDQGGRNAWIGFMHNDAAEIFLQGIYPDVAAFETAMRVSGWIFPAKGNPSPAEHGLSISDSELIGILG